MNARKTNMTTIHPVQRFLAILGALACLVITVAVWRSVSAYQGMWPLPGLYFIELLALAIFATFASLRGGPSGRIITWAAVGILISFCILGAFSVGFLYLPVALIFAILAVSSTVRQKHAVSTSLAVCLIAGLAQAGLMLAVIRLL